MITDLREIRRLYCRLWFWIDFVASVPFDIILKSSDDNQTNEGEQSGGNDLNKLLRLIRIFKLLRVLRMVRIIKRLEERLIFSPAVMRLLKYASQYMGVAGGELDVLRTCMHI